MVVDNKNSNDFDANLSFTHDLADRLQPLKRILPPHLATLIPSLPPAESPSTTTTPSDPATTPTPTVPYSLLYSISKWTRTEEGTVALTANSLNPCSYGMVSLLAGLTTSPERKFPPHEVETEDPLANARREINDRKAVVTLINALLSVGGSGAATWYATGVVGWRNEWVRIHSLH